MNETAIHVEGLGKKYRIGRQQANYKRFTETVMEVLTAPVRRLGSLGKPAPPEETLWALRDVSFQVNRGQVLGIIGRNGAGKTTLLKVLSRVTEPTKGYIEIHGRVGSLLEVGTGFHPELTGRENIYLSGAIMGMKRAEVNRKFDDIVAFSELERFLDTPVKRYSSGMFVRLAFSVAAHIEPDILIVDEVLAVGDAEFRKKSLGKMEDVVGQGRTVLFVSHNMGVIQNLCTRAILLDEGKIMLDGSVDKVVEAYLTIGAEQGGERVWPDINRAPGNDTARLHAVRVMSEDGQVCSTFDVREPVTVEIKYWVLQPEKNFMTNLAFRNHRGELLFETLDNLDAPWQDEPRPPGTYKATCHVPPDFLNDGQIFLTVALTNHSDVHALVHDVVMFNVSDAMDPGGVRGNYEFDWSPAAVRPRLRWSVKRMPLNEGNG